MKTDIFESMMQKSDEAVALHEKLAAMTAAKNKALEALKVHRDAMGLLLKALPAVSVQIDGVSQLTKLDTLIAELEEVKI